MQPLSKTALTNTGRRVLSSLTALTGNEYRGPGHRFEQYYAIQLWNFLDACLCNSHRPVHLEFAKCEIWFPL